MVDSFKKDSTSVKETVCLCPNNLHFPFYFTPVFHILENYAFIFYTHVNKYFYK